MPTSSSEGKHIIRSWVEEFSLEINTVLDLGVGKGTYKKIYSEKKSKPLKHAKWIGVEAWEPYINDFNLRSLYDQIIHDDIRNVDYNSLPYIDLVFAGDVLEHITKDEAIAVVSKLLENSSRIVISIPIIHYPQEEFNNNPFEVHVKDDWSHEEMMDTFKNITKFWVGEEIGVYLLEK